MMWKQKNLAQVAYTSLNVKNISSKLSAEHERGEQIESPLLLGENLKIRRKSCHN